MARKKVNSAFRSKMAKFHTASDAGNPTSSLEINDILQNPFADGAKRIRYDPSVTLD
jgi:hypothetical protein